MQIAQVSDGQPYDVAAFVDYFTKALTPEQLAEAEKRFLHGRWPSYYVNSETGRRYTPHHEVERVLVESDRPKFQLAKGGEGGGKALALGTPLPTPIGWTTMADVQVGDWLFDGEGCPCRVTAISNVMYDHECYEVKFSDGRSIIADAEHLWLTSTLQERKCSTYHGEPRLTIPLPLCLPPSIRTTRDILGTLRDYRGFINHAIDLAAPLLLEDANLPIDPYTLGAWLGDGTSASASITIGKQDQSQMVRLIEAEGHRLNQRQDGLVFGIDVHHAPMRNPGSNKFESNPRSFYTKLKALDLIQNKHIPAIYLRASYDQRLALMQGLMDTDGYISRRGKCEFCTASKVIADDFDELCVSLGIKAVLKRGMVKCNGKTFIRYRFAFTPYIPVFRLPRKVKRIPKPGRHAIRQARRYIVAIEKCQSVPVKCVMVDSPSRLYLAGRGMIPTHNSVLGIVKDLDRLRRGCDGCMISPDLEHFKKSLWPEFARWCPWDMVIDRQLHRREPGWEPRADFKMVFHNELGGFSTLVCGGAVETDPKRWEGLNINFAHLDEMRRHKSPIIFKTILGRVRIPGPNGEPPQLWITTTPAKHWLYDYFGPMVCRCQDCQAEFEWDLAPNTVPTCPDCYSTVYHTDDPWAQSKLQSVVATLLTVDNEPNTYDGFASDRGLTLTEMEKRVLLNAEWEDIEEGQRFLPNIIMWDQCRTTVPPLTPNEPIILGVDAAKGRQDDYSDCFAIVGVSRHWDKRDRDKRKEHVVVRFVYTWRANPGQVIDFQGTDRDPGPERVIRDLCNRYAVKCMTYDPYQLHDLGQRLSREHIVWTREFSQMTKRSEADRDLLEAIVAEKVVHDGSFPILREHIDAADRKVDEDGHKLRIVKRMPNQPVDAAVALSMARYECVRLNLPI